MRLSLFCLLLCTVNQLCAPRAGAQTTIFFTGKLDGYPVNFAPVPQNTPSILIGMGDNLSFDYSSRFDQAGNPVPRTAATSSNQAIAFLQDRHYDALVPGAEDFDFGAEFLHQADLHMLASNMVSCVQSDPQGPQAPPGQAQVLLPSQASLPSSVPNGGSGGGKGKSGGSPSPAPSGGSSGSASTGASKSAATPGCQQPAASAHGFAKLAFPSAGSVYPWTTKLVISVPDAIDVMSATLKTTSDKAANPGQTIEYRLPRNAAPPNSLPHDNGSNYYIYDLSALATVDHDGTMKPTPNPIPPNSVFLWPGVSLTLHVTLHTTKPHLSTFSEDIRITVQRPFFDHAWRSFPAGCGPIGAPPCKYVVFGIVDPALQAQISQLNLAFNPAKKAGVVIANARQTYYAAFNEAASSLVQAAIAYESVNYADPGATYAVMAQMTPDIAAGLAKDIAYRAFTFNRLGHHFDVIFSAADVYSHTPNTTISWTPDDPERIPVITPRPLLLPESGDAQPRTSSGDFPLLRMTNPLGRLTITKDRASTTMVVDIAPPHAQEICKSSDFSTNPGLATPLANVPPCQNASAFECAVLTSMKRRDNADIALIERRDVYTGCYAHPNNGITPDEMIDRMLPEAGYLARVSLSGSTLKTLLQRNDAISNQDPSSTSSIAIDRNRGLVMLGITSGEPQGKNAKSAAGQTGAQDTYYIDGIALDPAKIYSVVTTDRLATGEPTFPELAQQDLRPPELFLVPPKDRPTDSPAAFRIADIVKEDLLGRKTVRSNVSKDQIVGSIPLSQPPSIPTKPTTVSGELAELSKTGGKAVLGEIERPVTSFETAWHSLQPNSSAVTSIPAAGELAQQGRPYLTITLSQLTGSYAYTHPNNSDQNIGTAFAGVTNPNANSPHSDAFSAADTFRLIKNQNRIFGYGVDQLVAFSRNRTGSTSKATSGILNTTGGPVPLSTSSLSANSFLLSPFAQYAPFRDQPHYLVSLRELSSFDLARSNQFVKSGSTVSGTSENLYFVLSPLRQHGYGFGVGPRYEFTNTSYVELGYLRQYNSNVLNALSITRPGDPVPVLKLTNISANTSVSGILAGVKNAQVNDVLNLQYNEVRQNGAYVLMQWNDTPLNLKRISNSITAFGNVFGPGNPATRSSTETRYAANFTDAVQFQILGNLSLGPQYSLFLFADQATFTPSSLVRQQMSVQVNYNFDWHQGLGAKALLGPTK